MNGFLNEKVQFSSTASAFEYVIGKVKDSLSVVNRSYEAVIIRALRGDINGIRKLRNEIRNIQRSCKDMDGILNYIMSEKK